MNSLLLSAAACGAVELFLTSARCSVRLRLDFSSSRLGFIASNAKSVGTQELFITCRTSSALVTCLNYGTFSSHAAIRNFRQKHGKLVRIGW